VAVIGGGLTGACLAALLARHAGLEAKRIALLAPEHVAPPLPAAGAQQGAQLRVAALESNAPVRL
jgi:glycine/D-amino acid oxidase-like deaminating enzyme